MCIDDFVIINVHFFFFLMKLIRKLLFDEILKKRSCLGTFLTVFFFRVCFLVLTP